MSIEAISWAYENGPDCPSQMAVLQALAWHAQAKSGVCWPSIQGICDRSKLKERAVQNNLKKLEQGGFIKRSIGGGRGGKTVYTLQMPGAKNPAPDDVNPAPDAPFDTDKPRISCGGVEKETPHLTTETPHLTTLNPAPDAPEPSGTVKEPSSSSSSAREAKTEMPIDDLYAEVLAAVGHRGPNLPAHWMPPAAQLHVNRWRTDLGLTDAQIIFTARESRKRHDEAPNGPKALDRVMANVSAQLTAPRLKVASRPQQKAPRKHFEVMAERMAKTGTEGV